MDYIFWMGNGTWKPDSGLYLVHYDSWNSIWKAVLQDCEVRCSPIRKRLHLYQVRKRSSNEGFSYANKGHVIAKLTKINIKGIARKQSNVDKNKVSDAT